MTFNTDSTRPLVASIVSRSIASHGMCFAALASRKGGAGPLSVWKPTLVARFMQVWEIHPALVHFPLAFFVAAVVLEWFGGARPSETRTLAEAGLLVAGVVAGWFAA